jgi:hypothetical protein
MQYYCPVDEFYMLVKLLNYIVYNYCFFYECSCKVTSSLFRTNVCICDMFYI